MRAQSSTFILLAGLILLAMTASCQQTFLGVTGDTIASIDMATSEETTIEETATSSTSYVLYVYLGTTDFSSSCLLTTSQQTRGTGEGLLFEDFDDIKNICVTYESSRNQLYLVAVDSRGNELVLVTLGTFVYSYRIIYDTGDEEVSVERTSQGASGTFKSAEESVFTARSLTAYYTADEDYSEVEGSQRTGYFVQGYDTAWATINEDSYEITMKISANDEECFKPTKGRLARIDICVYYDSQGFAEVYADDVFITRSNGTIGFQTYSKIAVTYSTFDDFLWFTSAVSTSTATPLWYVIALEVVYQLEEGDLSTSVGGTITASLSNEDRAARYDCVTFKHTILESSSVYPAIEGLCLACEQDSLENLNCTVSFRLARYAEEVVYAPFTMKATPDELQQSASVTLDLDADQFVFKFLDTKGEIFSPRSMTKYVDEILEWSGNLDAYTVESLNEMLLLEHRAEHSSELLDSFYYVPSLQFGDERHEDYGLFCNDLRCYLGQLSGTVASAVKEYRGKFTDYVVYRFTDNNIELVCLSFSNSESVAINDCATKAQWLRYQNIILQYPIWKGEINYTDWTPAA